LNLRNPENFTYDQCIYSAAEINIFCHCHSEQCTVRKES